MAMPSIKKGLCRRQTEAGTDPAGAPGKVCPWIISQYRNQS